MAEFINIPIQEVPYGQAVQLNVRKACTKGYIMHREGAGIVTLKGPSSGCCCSLAASEAMTLSNIDGVRGANFIAAFFILNFDL